MDSENKNIMIVDDDAITATVLKKLLTTEGYEVTYCNSAVKGTTILQSKFFPMVITDISMPDMGGLAFLKWINENTPKTDVILMTGFGTKEIKDVAKQRGAVNFFEKPIDMKRLTQFVKSKFSGHTFTGSIREISLPEFIQMFLLSNKKRRIIITDTNTQDKGTVFIHEGNIVHAEFGDLVGEYAFYSLMKLNNGVFIDEEWIQPHQFTINKTAEFLMNQSTQLRKNNRGLINDPNDKELTKLKQHKKILIVDDDMLTRLIIEKYLVQHNYNAVAISSAIEGQNILTKESFDLVITDINMPDISGIDFLIWIKANSPRTKVIVMTGFSSEATKKFVSQSGAINYLEKPLDLRELDSYITDKLINNSFSGFVKDIDLLDYIKVLSFSKSTKKVSVIDLILNKTAFIYIKSGNIIHCEFGEIHGEQAFFHILKMEHGIFTDIKWEEPSEISIKIPFEELLVEAEIVNTNQNINRKLKINEEKSQNKSLRVVEKNDELVSINNIDDERLGIFGLYIGQSDKNRVLDVMKNHSKTDITNQMGNQLFSFDDITVNILFNDDGIIEEFNFGEFYKGATYSGISIGDSIQKAIDVYGKPRTCTIRGAVWKHIAFFSRQGTVISSMRLRKSTFFDNTTHEMKLSDSEKKVLDMVRYKIETQESLSLDYTIHEDGYAMDIYLGKTTREQVIEIMTKYSEAFNDLRSNDVKYIYDDISTTIIFDSTGIVSEMNFGMLYKGQTQKGLSIGSTVDRAVQIYGEPKFKNFSNTIWDNISVFSEDFNVIDSIRISLN